MMKRSGPVSVKEIQEVNLPFELARILAAIHAQRSDKTRAVMMKYGKSVNVDRAYPYHFLNRTLGSKSRP